MFLATGQDPAQNVESSNCMTLMEVYARARSISRPAAALRSVSNDPLCCCRAVRPTARTCSSRARCPPLRSAPSAAEPTSALRCVERSITQPFPALDLLWRARASEHSASVARNGTQPLVCVCACVLVDVPGHHGREGLEPHQPRRQRPRAL
jgi:hypothetical protein